MSTRSCIARKTKTGFSGTYHHWDGYPSGLGKELFRLFQVKKNLRALAKYAIDEHSAGWSSMIPSPARGDFPERKPDCFCHDKDGKPTGETFAKMTEKTAANSGCEYAYVLTTKNRVPTMLILSSVSSRGTKMIGMFGMGDPESTWKQIASLDLTGPEPDWKNVDASAFDEPAAETGEGVSP